jgi:hypothetical protein
MNQTKMTIWTWCPRCAIRTSHIRRKSYLRCLACGCLHLGAQIVEKVQTKEVKLPGLSSGKSGA